MGSWTRFCLSGPDLSRVHHDRRDRREGGSRPLAASVRAVAGGAWVVPVRPHRHPPDLGAQRDRPARSPGIVSRACYPCLAAPARSLCLRIPLRTTGRRAWLAWVCAAPPAVATWSFGWKPHPRSSLGLVAPAPVLYALEYTHDFQRRYVCPRDYLLSHYLYVGLQQHERQPPYRHLASLVF